jgi:hypothetical protein
MKKTQMFAILATVFILAGSSFTALSVKSAKQFPDLNVISSDKLKFGLTDYFKAEGAKANLEYTTDKPNFLAVEGLAHEITNIKLTKSSDLGECDHIVTITDTPQNKYLALCDSGRKIYQVRIEEDGFENGYVKFKEPEFFKKKSDSSIVMVDIPKLSESGETPKCYDLAPIPMSPGYFYAACSDGVSATSYDFPLIFKVETPEPKENGLKITIPDPAQFSKFLKDQGPAKELSKFYNLNFSNDGKLAIGTDTFNNMDLVNSGDTKKTGYWMYSIPTGTIKQLKDRTFVEFAPLIAQTDALKMDAKFRLSSVSWYQSGLNYYAILSGFIPNDGNGGFVASYVVEHVHDTTASKFKDFKIIKKISNISLDETWGKLINLSVTATFDPEQSSYTLRATSYNQSQGWFIKKSDFSIDDSTSQNKNKYKIKNIKLNLGAENLRLFPTAYKMTDRNNWSFSVRDCTDGTKYTDIQLFNHVSESYFRLGSAHSVSEITIKAPQDISQQNVYPARDYFLTFEAGEFRVYIMNFENFLTIDGSKTDDGTATLTAKAIGVTGDGTSAETKIKFTRLT